MTSPGGRIVARVGVRVLPNTGTFRRSLDRFLNRTERALRVEIPTVLDTSGLDADLRALKERLSRTRPAKIPVEYDQSTLSRRPLVAPVRVSLDALNAGFEQQVRAEVAKIVKTVQADIPLTARGELLRARVREQISEIERNLTAEIPTHPADAADYRRRLALMVRAASQDVKAEVRVDVDRGFLNRLRNGLGAIIGLNRRGSSTFGELSDVGNRTFRSLASNVGSFVSTAVSGFSAIAGRIGTVLVPLFAIQYAIPALATAVVGLGGLAVAAFGAIAAGALGLPVVLSSLLGPIAAIALGMDGIKRAAEPIKDEVQKLKDIVNIAFELNMRPVFERLQAIFPLLNVGISESARALSRFAMDLTDVVTSEAGMENLRIALAGISDVLDRARFGAKTLFTSLLNVAGTRELYDILGDTIGGVAERFGHMIERVRSSGDLAGALTQLRDLLFGVTDMLVVLTEGAIKFFTSAGPGLSSFFASLTEVLSRIDWAALGESFGGLMERLGTALENIPPEKWRELADSIGALSEKFLQMVEEGAFIDLIEGIAGLGNALLVLKSGIDAIEAGINGLNDTLQGAGQAIYDNVTGPFYRAVADLFGFLGIASPAQKFLDLGLAIIEGILLGLAGGPAAVFAKIQELGRKALDALANAPTLLVEKGRNIVDGASRGISERLDSARAKAAEIKDKVLDALADAKNWLVGLGAGMVGGFVRGIGSQIAEVGRAAAAMARSAYDAAAAALRSGSPSRLFAELGHDTADGYIVGLRDRYPEVDAAIARIFADVDGAVGQVQDSGALAGIPAQLAPTVAEMAEAFLQALSRVAMGSDEIAIMVNRANAELARR